jgi:hypothetical protein
VTPTAPISATQSDREFIPSPIASDEQCHRFTNSLTRQLQKSLTFPRPAKKSECSVDYLRRSPRTSVSNLNVAASVIGTASETDNRTSVVNETGRSNTDGSTSLLHGFRRHSNENSSATFTPMLIPTVT